MTTPAEAIVHTIPASNTIVEEVHSITDHLREFTRRNRDVLIVLGGTIPEQDVPFLNSHGVRGIFGPGTPMDAIIQFIRSNVKPRGVPAA